VLGGLADGLLKFQLQSFNGYSKECNMQDRPDAQPESKDAAEASQEEQVVPADGQAVETAEAAKTGPEEVAQEGQAVDPTATADVPAVSAEVQEEAAVKETAEEATPETVAAAPAVVAEAVAGETSGDAAATEGAEGGEDFAAMLADTEKTAKGKGKIGALKVGDKISGVIAKLGPDSSFIDFGGRSEGAIKTVELQDGEGQAIFAVGDPIEAFVTAVGGSVELTRSLTKQDRQADMLYQAFKSGIPVEGKVTAVNQWGLGVEVQGVRAFCPVSQIDTKYVESTDEYREQTMEFKIIRFRDQGRNIVVSRRALLEVGQQEEASEVRGRLEKGSRLKGKVTRLEDFGAFVDLGAGVEGLVHVSEMRHERVGHPKEVLAVDQEVEILVLGVKSLGSKRKERISLSLKALEKDPWTEAVGGLKRGSIVDGKIEALEDYGAFAEVAENVRGMIHVSEIADHRVNHPRDVLSVGDEVKVAIIDIDKAKRRLRLSIRQVETMESSRNLKEFQARQKKEHDDDASTNSMIDALRRAQLIE
jgi:small subunit ribosomal protein S1